MELFSKYCNLFNQVTSTSIHILSILWYLRYRWPWISLLGHRRSLILAPIESAYKKSYWSSIVTLVILPLFREILYAESHFFRTPPVYSGQNFGCSHWNRPPDVGVCWELTNREIIFEDLQYVINDTSTSWTDGQTDGQFAVVIPRSA